MRTCNKCGVNENTKPFHIRDNICKECHNTHLRTKRATNPESFRLRSRRHYKKHKNKINAKAVKKYADDPITREKRKPSAKARANYLVNVQKTADKFIKHITMDKVYSANMIKKGTRKRTNSVCVTVDIDPEFMINIYKKQKGKCALSGVNMLYQFNSLFGISIDRKDSTIGYTKNNVQLVCQFINAGKRHFSDSAAMDVIKAIKDAQDA